MPLPLTHNFTLSLAFALCLTGLAPSVALGNTVTLSGAFTSDDNVQLFNLGVASSGSVDLRSYGYAGGITPTGQTIAAGGFDTVLMLFSTSGVLITDNEDGSGVSVDPSTGATSDARVTVDLSPGNSILALTQYDNFARGINLSEGFVQTGHPDFTADPTLTSGGSCPGNAFRDISRGPGSCRNGPSASGSHRSTSIGHVFDIHSTNGYDQCWR